MVAEQRWANAREKQARVLRFGSRSTDALRVQPGGHDVGIEVAWEGKRARERIWGELQPNATRRLRVKLGGLLNRTLRLEWE